MPIEHTQWSVGEELRSTGAHDLFLHMLLRVRVHHHEDDHLRAGSEVERGRDDSLHWLVSVAGGRGQRGVTCGQDQKWNVDVMTLCTG